MYRLSIIFLFIASLACAQAKKPLPKTTRPTAAAVKDSLRKDSLAMAKEEVAPLPKEFAVYTKRPKVKTQKIKLCINLVNGDSIFNHCVNDSLCRDPEISKILFEKKQADSTYILVYVRAFSKPDDKPSCDAGKEVKLFYVRLNNKTNKAVVKIRNVESCMRGITNMTRESIDSWDKTSPLIFKYHKGAQNYVELKFDPQNYLMGFQSVSDN